MTLGIWTGELIEAMRGKSNQLLREQQALREKRLATPKRAETAYQEGDESMRRQLAPEMVAEVPSELINTLRTGHPGERHLMINAAQSDIARARVKQLLVDIAEQDLYTAQQQIAKAPPGTEPKVPCWFGIEVPIARSITADELLNRIVRRLYFEGALAGLSAHPALREFTKELRKGYLQTRGAFEVRADQKTKSTVEAGVGAELSLKGPKLTAQLGAGDELEFLASEVARLERANEWETEDIIYYNLNRLTRVDLQLSDLTGAGAQTYALRAMDHVSRWLSELRRFVKPEPVGHGAVAIQLNLVIVLYAIQHLAVDELAKITEMLRNILVSVPARFICVGGLFQELIWQEDHLRLRPRLGGLFRHAYLDSHQTFQPRNGKVASDVAEALRTWEDALTSEARLRTLDGEDVDQGGERTRVFCQDLRQLLSARLGTWQRLTQPGSDKITAKELNALMATMQSSQDGSESLLWHSVRELLATSALIE